MRVKKLTDLAVRQMKPDPNKRLEIPDPGKPGLYSSLAAIRPSLLGVSIPQQGGRATQAQYRPVR